MWQLSLVVQHPGNWRGTSDGHVRIWSVCSRAWVLWMPYSQCAPSSGLPTTRSSSQAPRLCPEPAGYLEVPNHGQGRLAERSHSRVLWPWAQMGLQWHSQQQMRSCDCGAAFELDPARWQEREASVAKAASSTKASAEDQLLTVFLWGLLFCFVLFHFSNKVMCLPQKKKNALGE